MQAEEVRDLDFVSDASKALGEICQKIEEGNISQTERRFASSVFHGILEDQCERAFLCAITVLHSL